MQKRYQLANIAFILILLVLFGCSSKIATKTKPIEVKKAKKTMPKKQVTFDKPYYKGISYPAYNAKVYLKAESDREIRRIASTGANTIALVPLWYTTNLTQSDIHPEPEDTATDASLIHAIKLSHSLGIKVNLKPFVDPKTGGTWRAKYHPKNWQEWFNNYNVFIKHYATIAQQNGVELLTIGTEYTSSDGVREANWREVIKNVRNIYKGKITYAADYQDIKSDGPPYRGGYRNIRFWDALDYIGIDGYFPLAKKPGESKPQLVARWQKWIFELENWGWVKEQKKQIIFTEIGYGSYPGTTVDTGHWDRKTTTVSLSEQANAYEAVFVAFEKKPWFAGMYWWAWDNPSTFDWKPHIRKFFFTPKGKPAERVLHQWFKKTN
ncbi:MAG: hypothetical protein C4562_03500 [Actinobacteria bacterium]|nr:MAG: hypothetical protein C4562_03500 [Actinomycetota bacterium]